MVHCIKITRDGKTIRALNICELNTTRVHIVKDGVLVMYEFQQKM